MANGRNQIHRRKKAVTARNHKPRASSPEGREVRKELRAKHTPVDPTDKKLHYIRPGSNNPKKIGR